MERKRIIIADDHPIFRSGLRSLIEAEPAFTVAGEAVDGSAALELITRELPDVAILDFNMPELNGFEVLERLQRLKLGVVPVMLTMHNDEAMFEKAFALGVRGYVLKDGAGVEIVNCLQAVTRGQVYTSAAVTTYLFKRSSPRGAASGGLGSLTPAERKVLGMIGEYKTSREIAEELFVSIRTVENHRNNICSKLDLQGSHALMKFAIANRGDLP